MSAARSADAIATSQGRVAATRRRRGAVDDLSDLATLVHRLSALLAAGLPPVRAWRYAAQPPFAAVGAAVEEGGPTGIPAAIAGVAAGAAAPARRTAIQWRARAGPVGRAQRPIVRAWEALGATWAVATEAGAALAPTLRAHAELLRSLAAAERAARVALAGPRATARLVLVLPVVAFGFGLLLGYDVVGVLLGTPLGWGCLVAGALLMLAGSAWSRRLLGRAQEGEVFPGLAEELFAVALSGGIAVDRARRLVAAALERAGLAVDFAGAEAAVALAAETGAPVAELLRAAAEDRRRAAASEAAERAERLGVTLLLPVGVCVLPAFVAFGVVPLMASVVGSTLGGI